GETRLVDTTAKVGAVLDLAPMFLGASAIRALLGGGLVLHGTFVEQFVSGAALASTLNNLPAAAAVRAVASSGRWAAILAMAVGPAAAGARLRWRPPRTRCGSSRPARAFARGAWAVRPSWSARSGAAGGHRG